MDLKIGVLKLAATYRSIIVCRSRVIRVSIHPRLLGRWSKLRKKCGEKRAGQPFSRTGHLNYHPASANHKQKISSFNDPRIAQRFHFQQKYFYIYSWNELVFRSWIPVRIFREKFFNTNNRIYCRSNYDGSKGHMYISSRKVFFMISNWFLKISLKTLF